MCSDHLQVTLPDGGLQRMWHSTTAITLCPGLVEVIVFGGTTEDYVGNKPMSSYSRIAETTIITFGELDYICMCLATHSYMYFMVWMIELFF